MKKVIITGITGFLGEALVEKLLERGINITIVFRNPEKVSEKLLLNELVHPIMIHDIGQILKLPKTIRDRDFDVFYHFAWEGTSGEKREDYEVQIKNIKATCEAVKVAKELDCKKFVNAGSLMEYESIKCMKVSEKQPAGNYLYRSAKLAAHYMAKAEAGKLDIPFINMIISNVYGRGEWSERFINMTLRKIIMGDKISFTSGTQLYDFIHIKDAVEAFYLIGEYGQAYKDYYIGSNDVRSLRKYIEELFECLPVEIEPEFGEIPYDGISLSYEEFNRENLKKDTGFQCKVSFQEGILDTYRWLEEIIKNELKLGK